MYPMSQKEATLFYLPKNIRKMGQAEEKLQIYMEDYVMSYIKYLGVQSGEEENYAILLGKKEKWENKQIIFITGSIQLPTVYIEHYAIEKEKWDLLYEKIHQYFPSAEIVGWSYVGIHGKKKINEEITKIHTCNFMGTEKVLLLYEPVERQEKFYYMQQGTFHACAGYTLFYEKNEEMQEYLLEQKGEVEQEKIDGKVVEHMRKNLGKMQERKEKNKKQKKRIRIAILGIGSLIGLVFLTKSHEITKNMETFSYVTDSEEDSHMGNLVTLAKGSAPTKAEEKNKKEIQQKPSKEKKKQQEKVIIAESEENQQGKMADTESEENRQGKMADTESEENRQGKMADTESEENQQGKMADTESEENQQGKMKMTESDQAQRKLQESLGLKNQNAVVIEPQNNKAEQDKIQLQNNIPQYYTIKPGDTLVHICMDQFQSVENMEKIMEMNGITDKNCIEAGKQIKLWE